MRGTSLSTTVVRVPGEDDDERRGYTVGGTSRD